MKGHPGFISQHGTVTCCRGCLYKWHKIPIDTKLNDKEKDYIVNVIIKGITKELNEQCKKIQ